jgi:hypothetical protein
LGGIGAERLLLFGGGSRFDLADLNVEGIADLLKAAVGSGIPGGVINGARSDQANPKFSGRLGPGTPYPKNAGAEPQ